MITGSVPGTELCTAVGPETSIMGCALRVRVLHDHRFGTGGRVMCCCGAGRVDQHIPCPRRQSSGGQVGEMPGHEVIVGPVSSRARGCRRAGRWTAGSREPGAGSRADAVPDHGPPNSRARRLLSSEWIKPDAARPPCQGVIFDTSCLAWSDVWTSAGGCPPRQCVPVGWSPCPRGSHTQRPAETVQPRVVAARRVCGPNRFSSCAPPWPLGAALRRLHSAARVVGEVPAGRGTADRGVSGPPRAAEAALTPPADQGVGRAILNREHSSIYSRGPRGQFSRDPRDGLLAPQRRHRRARRPRQDHSRRRHASRLGRVR